MLNPGLHSLGFRRDSSGRGGRTSADVNISKIVADDRRRSPWRGEGSVQANREALSHPTVVLALNQGVFQLPAGGIRTQAQSLLNLLEHR
jgi:hypothetical protein